MTWASMASPAPPGHDDDRSERGHRRDGREHRDSFHDDYEDSERGDDDYDNSSAMRGVLETTSPDRND